MDFNLLNNAIDMVMDEYSEQGQNEDNNSILNMDNHSFIKTVNIPEYGCEHYLSRCKIIAPCCNESFNCRICHDNIKYYENNKDPHEIDRYSVKRIICTTCNLEQDLHQYCTNCNTCFGLYFCEKCLVIDDIDKGQVHCEKCKICRVGDADFYHCDGCNICISTKLKGNHNCIDITDYNCPICMDCISESIKEIHIMKCGHFIHTDCFLEYLKTSYTCPLCFVSIIDTEEINKFYDKEIEETPMPDDYKDTKVIILCNDCHEESEVNFHIIGLKCTNCSSYNTRKL